MLQPFFFFFARWGDVACSSHSGVIVPVAIFLFLVFGLFDRTARGTVGCSWKGGSEGE